jgi:hypothetical protein
LWLAGGTFGPHFRHVNAETIQPAAGNPVDPAVLVIHELGKEKENKPWLLTVYRSHMTLGEHAGEPPHVILRSEIMKSVMISEGLGILSVQQPAKMNFKLSRDEMREVVNWIGVEFLCRFYLTRRFKMIVPWAVLMILVGLVSLAEAQWAEGMDSNRFRLVTHSISAVSSMCLGAILFACWAISKWRPHPALFLFDGLWFVGVGINLALGVLQGRSAWLLILAVTLCWGGLIGLKHFVRFRKVRLCQETLGV